MNTEVEIEPAEVVETPDVVEEEVVEETAEEAVEETAEEETEDVVEESADETEEAIAPIEFAEDATIEQIVEQASPILDKYELPADVQSYIDVLRAKAEAVPLAEYEAYGSSEEVKELLDRESYLNTSRAEGELIRPNTDKFVETLPADRANWLAYDLGQQPSAKYSGYTRFEEMLVDNLAVEGDTVPQTLDRYHKFVGAMKENALPYNDVPTFVPANLKEAYFKLSVQRRDEIKDLDPDYEMDTIRDHLADLELVQKGLDGERAEKERLTQYQAAQKQSFENDVMQTQNTFFATLRDQFAKDVQKEVKFSDDPKMQTLLSNQQVTLIMQAFDEGQAGDFARNTLSNAGINFDYTQGQVLLNEINVAAVDLIRQKYNVDGDGKPLDKVALNRAQSNYENISRKWVKLAKDTLHSMSQAASTGKKADIQKAVEKVKLAPKARVAPSNGTKAKQVDLISPYVPGTDDDLAWWADRHIEAQAKRARAYA